MNFYQIGWFSSIFHLCTRFSDLLCNQKLHFLLIIQKWKLYFSITKPCRYEFEATVFNQGILYLVPLLPYLLRWTPVAVRPSINWSMSEKAKCRGNPQTLCEVMILWSSLRCSVAIEVELSTFRLKPPFVVCPMLFFCKHLSLVVK